MSAPPACNAQSAHSQGLLRPNSAHKLFTSLLSHPVQASTARTPPPSRASGNGAVHFAGSTLPGRDEFLVVLPTASTPQKLRAIGAVQPCAHRDRRETFTMRPLFSTVHCCRLLPVQFLISTGPSGRFSVRQPELTRAIALRPSGHSGFTRILRSPFSPRSSVILRASEPLHFASFASPERSMHRSRALSGLRFFVSAG